MRLFLYFYIVLVISVKDVLVRNCLNGTGIFTGVESSESLPLVVILFQGFISLGARKRIRCDCISSGSFWLAIATTLILIVDFFWEGMVSLVSGRSNVLGMDG